MGRACDGTLPSACRRTPTRSGCSPSAPPTRSRASLENPLTHLLLALFFACFLLPEVPWRQAQALAEVRGGGKTRADAKRDLDSATAAIETSLKALLGDRGMLALRDLRRKEDQALRAESAPAAQK